jgi:hypothetical protein
MSHDMTRADAQAALATVEESRLQVVDEIDMPRWYWWGLALGWIALGVITDRGNAWLTFAATLAFGACHSYAFSRVAAGRRSSDRVRVRAQTAGWFGPVVVIGSLLLLAAMTVLIAVLADAAGLPGPVTIASVVVAITILLGGPRLMAVVRRRAARPAHAS